tara:strand:+ start:632 stop:1483 length:852 start_codon:yes stop_codon:yes gene_type:complete
MANDHQWLVYHKVQDELRGRELLPLNAMGCIAEDALASKVYAEQNLKYAGARAALKQMRIPGFSTTTLWNDVIHTSVIHPHLVYDGLVRAGSSQAKRGVKFFSIDLSKLILDRDEKEYSTKSKNEGHVEIVALRGPRDEEEGKEYATLLRHILSGWVPTFESEKTVDGSDVVSEEQRYRALCSKFYRPLLTRKDLAEFYADGLWVERKLPQYTEAYYMKEGLAEREGKEAAGMDAEAAVSQGRIKLYNGLTHVFLKPMQRERREGECGIEFEQFPIIRWEESS